jgi:hypothetical protein
MPNETQSSDSPAEAKENIEIPPIPKTAAGAATGAVVGAVAGPVGAVVGGVLGAVLGKRAERGKPLLPAVKRGARKAAGGAKAAIKTARAAVPAAKRA